MVYLDRIYTRSGDGGETSLGDGTRVDKTDPRIVAFGAIDELNAVLGVVRAGSPPAGLDQQLATIQNDLFDLGADLCLPDAETAGLRVTAAQVEALEHCIEEDNEPLPPLTSFVLPGGTPLAAGLHHARTVCRRAEIEVLKLAETGPVNAPVREYLNRLSDLLFVLARANNDKNSVVTWTPGGEAGEAS